AAQPQADLVVGHHLLRRVPLAEVDGVAHVIGVGVGDEHRVEPVELPAFLRAGGVALDPGIDEHDLPGGQIAAHGGVAEVGEAGARMRGHGSSSLRSVAADSNRYRRQDDDGSARGPAIRTLRRVIFPSKGKRPGRPAASRTDPWAAQEGPPPRQNSAQTWNCLKKLSRSLALNSWSVSR